MGGFGPWPGQPSTGGGGAGFFSAIYDAGEADAPAVDNLMTGTLQQFFINLGATPPPFPPTNPAHFPEGALFVGETPADTGVGADSKPLWRMRRWFSTFPSVGDQIWHETRYDLFGGGINTASGGDRNLHTIVDQFENRLTFAIHDWQLTRPGLNAPGYTPTYLDNAPVSYQEFQLLDALGGGNSNNWQFNSDGSQFRRVLIPNVIGPGGGPAGPWTYVADAMSMWSRNGGEPLVGSTLFYDAVTVQTFGAVDTNVTQFIVGQAAVLDAKNLGSGQAAGHGETWIRSTLGGPLVLVASWFDDLVDIPVELITHNGAVFIGGATVDGTTSTTGDINAGGDVNAGVGAMHAGNEVTAGAEVTQYNGQWVPVVLRTPEIDFTVAAPQTVTFDMIPAPGKVFIPMVNANFVRGRLTAASGVLTTRPSGTIGNNVAVTNFLSVAADFVTAALFAGGVGAEATVGGSDVVQVPADLTAPMQLKIGTAAAGAGLVLRGFVYIPGYLVDV